MKFEEFQKMMQKHNEEEMTQIKDKLYLIKSKVNGKNIFDVLREKNPPLKAYKLCLGLQTLYEEIFGQEYFIDLKWLDYKDTLEKLQEEGPFNYEGIHGLLWLIDCVGDTETIEKYSCLESIID